MNIINDAQRYAKKETSGQKMRNSSFGTGNFRAKQSREFENVGSRSENYKNKITERQAKSCNTNKENGSR